MEELNRIFILPDGEHKRCRGCEATDNLDISEVYPDEN